MYIENAKKLTKDSFRERELYDELLAIENELDRSIAVNDVRRQAKELGITTEFDATWKGALREEAKFKRTELSNTNAIFAEGLTDFSGLDIASQLRCGAWIADDNGVRVRSEKGEVTIVCPHPIYPTRVLRNSETGKYKVEIEFFIRGQKRNIFVSREVLASPSKILSLANDSVQVTALTAPYLVKYLSELESLNPDLIKEYTSTSRLGWIDYKNQDGVITKQFLPYQNEVIFDNELGMKSLFDSIREEGSREKWYSLIKEIRAKKQPEVLINLAASFASVLVEPCGTLPFIVSLWGGTGIGKSVILKICTSVWADPGEGKYITDAKATNTAMEIRLNILNSLPMTLDDMAQVKNQYDEDFSELIYRWCAGKGRDRSNKELGLNKLTSWRNCTITNGERSLVDESTQGGAVNRVIDIEASGEVLFNGKTGNRVCKCIEKNYGYAGREFIDLITNLGDSKLNEVYQAQYDRLKNAASEQGMEKEEKQIIPMALILTADYLTEKYLFSDGITLDVNNCVRYLRNKDEVSEHERAYEYIVATVAMNPARFDEDEENKIERWGFMKSDDVVAFSIKSLKRQLSEGGFQAKAFLSWCKKKGLLELDPKGNVTKNVRGKNGVFKAAVINITYDSETDEQSQNGEFITIDDDLKLPFD